MSAEIVQPTYEMIVHAAECLQNGGLVAMPTETVYGLACDASNPVAVARLYAAKGRPKFNPLIAHVLDVEAARRQAQMSQTALDLAAGVWPGPLTIVSPIADTHTVCDLARAGLDTIALRAPAHPVGRQLLEAFGGPLVAPSANPSGRVSPTLAAHVSLDMSHKIDLILDGGPCDIGIESTIVSCLEEPPKVLRPGAFDPGFAVDSNSESPAAPVAPGQLSRHYAPKAHLRLNATTAMPEEAYLGFGAGASTLNLSKSEDLIEAAANLFSMLRQLDGAHKKIAVAPIPHRGIGIAINDRLARAAKRD